MDDRMLAAERGAPGPHAFVAVTDNGARLTADTRGQLVDPYFSTEGAGRGLGLAAVAGAIRAHGGLLALESQESVGTTVTLCFPCGTAASAIL